MSDSTAPKTVDAPEPASTSETPKPEAPAFHPPASQEELDRMIGKRVAREREKFADYDELKVKAEKTDELQAALDKLQAEQQHTQWVLAASEATGVPAKHIRGDSEKEILAHAESLVELLKSGGTPVPAADKHPETKTSAERVFARNLFHTA